MDRIYADKLYEFLSELVATAQSQGDEQVVQRIDRARKHYMIPLPTGEYFRLPLTSEFLGESMLALREVLAGSKALLTPEQTSTAREYADTIKRQWFSHH